MSIKIRNKATGAPASLDAGELAINTTDNTLFAGDGTSVNTLLDRPIVGSAVNNRGLVYNSTSGAYEPYSPVSYSVTVSYTADVEMNSQATFWGSSNEASIFFLGTSWEFGLSSTATQTVDIVDAGGTRATFDTNGDLKISGNDLYTESTKKLTTGFRRFEMLTQAAYDALVAGAGTDANTLYFING